MYIAKYSNINYRIINAISVTKSIMGFLCVRDFVKRNFVAHKSKQCIRVRFVNNNL
jgi:hypothetical protein